MTLATERLTAALADRYRILRTLGAGGMATVYLAEDLRHDRKVAVKVLKPELAAVLGAERFVVEIKTTAALSHPHILPLFDSGEADGFLYYVMPYIEGETIREKLNRETQCSVEEALRITGEIADALDYAHRHGVIHRDIKPENILLHDGRPMVMDFGIALAVSAAAGGRMTETGLSLGTPHYMSPEQATADKQLTGRSDQYSLATVLYEMLAGEPPHTGASAQQIVMKIIAERAQPVTALRGSVPGHVAAALDRALSKLPADRFVTVREFAQALGDARLTAGATGPVSHGGATSGPRGLPWLTAALAVALVAVSAVAIVATRRRPPAVPESRVALALPVRVSPNVEGGSSIAVSADGSVLAFVSADSTGARRVWVKRTDELDAAPVLGTDEARSPFLSPDGRELGFFDGSSERMMAVVLAGGRPRVVTTDDVGGNGGFWATDGYIYFDSGRRGIDRVRPDGTARETVAPLDTAADAIGLAWPEVLPGNRVLVARQRLAGVPAAQFRIVAFDLADGSSVQLAKGIMARHMTGSLAILRSDGVLEARRLMQGGLALDTAAVTLATDVGVEAQPFGTANVTTDAWGTLHYVTTQGREEYRLVWVGADGRRVPADSGESHPDGRGAFLVGAPSGRRVLMVRPLNRDTVRLWTRDLPAGTMWPMSVDGGQLRGAGWGTTDDSLMLAVRVGGQSELRLLRADGLGTPVVIARDSLEFGGNLTATRGFRQVVAFAATEGQGRMLVLIDRTLGRVVDTLAIPPGSNPNNPELSPDGRFIAYQSFKSGRPEIVVQPFPNLDAGIWQISTGGGGPPRWSPRGDRLFFEGLAPQSLLEVDVSTSGTFTHGRARARMDATELIGLYPADGFGVSADGRLLMRARAMTDLPPQLVRLQRAR